MISSVSRCLNPYEKEGFEAMMAVALPELEHLFRCALQDVSLIAGLFQSLIAELFHDNFPPSFLKCNALAGDLLRVPVPEPLRERGL